MGKIELTPKEKKTLLEALNLLIDSEEDSVNHTKLWAKLGGKG